VRKTKGKADVRSYAMPIPWPPVVPASPPLPSGARRPYLASAPDLVLALGEVYQLADSATREVFREQLVALVREEAGIVQDAGHVDASTNALPAQVALTMLALSDAEEGTETTSDLRAHLPLRARVLERAFVGRNNEHGTPPGRSKHDLLERVASSDAAGETSAVDALVLERRLLGLSLVTVFLLAGEALADVRILPPMQAKANRVRSASIGSTHDVDASEASVLPASVSAYPEIAGLTLTEVTPADLRELLARSVWRARQKGQGRFDPAIDEVLLGALSP
jgi:hypothetical protein